MAAEETNQRAHAVDRAVRMAGAGAAGGVCGFLLSRVVQLANPSTNSGLAFTQGFWFLAVIGGIGSGVAWQSFSLGARRPNAKMAIAGAGALGLLGFTSGYLAQVVYSALVSNDALRNCFSEFRASGSDSELNWCFSRSVRGARLVGWMIAGALGGAGVGAFFLSLRRAQNAIVGGVAGGVFGGLIFDALPAVLGLSTLWQSQLLAIISVGAVIGALISLIETLRISAWVECLNGELRGRTFILTETLSRIGSDRSVEVPVIGDPDVEAIHAVFKTSHRGLSVEEAGGVVTVNGRHGAMKLTSGDVVQVGSTQLRVGLKRDLPSDDPFVPSPVGTSSPTQKAPKQRPTLNLKP